MSEPKGEKESSRKKKYEKPEVVDLANELLAEGAPAACWIYGGSAPTGTCSAGSSAPGGPCATGGVDGPTCAPYGGTATSSCIIGNQDG